MRDTEDVEPFWWHNDSNRVRRAGKHSVDDLGYKSWLSCDSFGVKSDPVYTASSIDPAASMA
jgi:hypothetical protein